jgi:ATP-dependent Clp protease ATP-binding subunit ClpA
MIPSLGGALVWLMIVMVIVGVNQASFGLALFIVAFAGVLVIGIVVYKGLYQQRYLPAPVLSLLDRRERAAKLAQEEQAKKAQLTVIDANELAAKLKSKVIGQDTAIDEMAHTLRARIAARRPNKPVAVLCFAGPPGVGKTLLAKVLSETLYGDDRHLHFIDMSQAHYSGAPAVYQQIISALGLQPNSVMLLDEFEKADRSIHLRFLTAWNDGFFTDANGAKIPTNGTIFILTTNASARRIGALAAQHKGTSEELGRLLKAALGDARFAPELLSRIDDVFAFRELKGLDIACMVGLEIEQVAKQYGLDIDKGGIAPAILLSAVDNASRSGAKSGGAREIARNIEKAITNELIEAKKTGAMRVRLMPEGERIQAIPVVEPSDHQVPPAAEPVPTAPVIDTRTPQQILLDRLTDRAALEQGWAKMERELSLIDAEKLAASLKARVIGQDEVIDHVTRTLRRRLSAKRPNKPVAVFCFAGAPGVGKTHLAKVLAEELYGSANHLHFIDMSQNASWSLFGSSKGHVGSDSYGQVTGALRDIPNSIMLLDEFEKAGADVHRRFLTAWNDGFVTEASDGAKIATNETVFILTTNAAAKRISEFVRDHKGTQQELDRVAKSMLAGAQFAPEVLSRIDNVFVFRDLQGLDVARIVALEIEGKAKEYELAIADGGIDPQILLNAMDKVAQHGAPGGAREIARSIEQQITDGLIDAKQEGATKVRLLAKGDDVIVVPVHDDAIKPGQSAEAAA